MNDPESPRRLRLSAAPGSALAAGLAQARTRAPTDAELRTLEAALAASLGAAAAGHAASTVPVTAPGLAGAAASKLAAILVALAAAAGGVAVLRHQHRAQPIEAHTIGAVSARATAPLPSPAPPAMPAAPEKAASQPARAEQAASAPRPRPAQDGLSLIARAQRALARDPAGALALLGRNRRTLAQSAFAQEAEVIAVAALARLGRTDEARARAARFVARFPESVHAGRMQRIAAVTQ